MVARRGPTTIVRNRLGLTMAAAGVDASNVEPGSVLLLPADPDGTARRLRREIAARSGANVGCRGHRHSRARVAHGPDRHRDRRGRAGGPRRPRRAHRRATATSSWSRAPALADELAGAAELAQGKLAARPFAVVRGRDELVLPAGEDGPGAAALVRDEGEDLFGYGAREAVVRALAGDPADLVPFGAPATADELAAAVALVLGEPAEAVDGRSGGPGRPSAGAAGLRPRLASPRRP